MMRQNLETIRRIWKRYAESGNDTQNLETVRGTFPRPLCIHEGRFTWRDQGLGCVEDLGTRWEEETCAPLPLGGILVTQALIDSSPDTVTKIQNAIQSSIKYAQANPDEALTTMRKHAQEFDDDVLMKHVQLYVNDWTVELGADGQSALATLSQRAKKAGIVDDATPEISVLKFP